MALKSIDNDVQYSKCYCLHSDYLQLFGYECLHMHVVSCTYMVNP
jgi:hypothetical protein